MKHAKKMIKVPASEYYALLNLIKSSGFDPLTTEKAMLDAKMRENLNDPNIDEHLKALRDAQLIKERRVLTQLIENKPQKVIIENQPNIPNLPPYLGLTPPPPQIKTEENIKPINKIQRKRRKGTDITMYSNDFNETDEDMGEEEEEEVFEDANGEQERKHITRKELFASPKINLTPRKRKELEKIIRTNIDKLPIALDGSIIGLNKQNVKNSNYKEALDYYEGKRDSSPKGKYFFERKLLTIPEARNLLNLNQHGSGKKRQVLIKLKPIKTIGLIREKQKIPFKPRLWAKL